MDLANAPYRGASYSKKQGASYANLFNKAKRQTIEAFSEKGEWKIALL